MRGGKSNQVSQYYSLNIRRRIKSQHLSCASDAFLFFDLDVVFNSSASCCLPFVSIVHAFMYREAGISLVLKVQKLLFTLSLNEVKHDSTKALSH